MPWFSAAMKQWRRHKAKQFEFPCGVRKGRYSFEPIVRFNGGKVDGGCARPLRMYPKPFHAAGLVFKVQADGAQTAQAGEPITRAAFPRGCSPYCFIGDAVFFKSYANSKK